MRSISFIEASVGYWPSKSKVVLPRVRESSVLLLYTDIFIECLYHSLIEKQLCPVSVYLGIIASSSKTGLSESGVEIVLSQLWLVTPIQSKYSKGFQLGSEFSLYWPNKKDQAFWVLLLPTRYCSWMNVNRDTMTTRLSGINLEPLHSYDVAVAVQ